MSGTPPLRCPFARPQTALRSYALEAATVNVNAAAAFAQSEVFLRAETCA
jgi:hypothetical protein